MRFSLKKYKNILFAALLYFEQKKNLQCFWLAGINLFWNHMNLNCLKKSEPIKLIKFNLKSRVKKLSRKN